MRPSRRASPEVKICGLRRREDVSVAAAAGATYAGLVLAESPRRLSPGEARELASAARELGLSPVGVFVDRGGEEIARLADRVGLAVVQLHGDEPRGACARLRGRGLEVWKAIRPRSREEVAALVERYRSAADALLVEGWSAERAGGTGTAFPHDWLAPGKGDPRPERLVLAGGLDPGSVGDAVRRVRPDVVDVSSGVEREPGVKDADRIRSFVERATRAGRELGESGSGSEREVRG